MHKLIIATLGVFLCAVAPAAAGLGEAGDLEHARANARAGGPLSAYDADLLQRYGCTSGTHSPYCHHYGFRAHRYHRQYRGNR